MKAIIQKLMRTYDCNKLYNYSKLRDDNCRNA